MSESFITAKTSEAQAALPGQPEGQLVRVEESLEPTSESIREVALAGAELNDIDELQRGLERSIITSGLQVMADKFGADSLLDAMQGSFNISEVVNKLTPSKQERADLIQAIQSESTQELADKFNEYAGGVATTSETHDSLNRHRKLGVDSLEKAKDTDEARELLSPALSKLFTEYPGIADSFTQTADTIILLKNIRDVYEERYIKLGLDIEDAKAAIEEKIAAIEAEAVETKHLLDEIHASEVSELERRLSAASSEAARGLIQGLLDKKATDILAERESLSAQYGDIRQSTITKLNAQYIYTAQLAPPAQPRPTFRYNQAVAA